MDVGVEEGLELPLVQDNDTGAPDGRLQMNYYWTVAGNLSNSKQGASWCSRCGNLVQ